MHYIYIYICICMCIYVYLYTFTHVCVCVYIYVYVYTSLVIQLLVKNLCVMQETPVQLLGWEDPLEEGRGYWQEYWVFLPGESDGQRSLVEGSPLGHKELDTNETKHSIAHMYIC